MEKTQLQSFIDRPDQLLDMVSIGCKIRVTNT